MKVIGIGDNVCDKYIHLKTMFPGGGQATEFCQRMPECLEQMPHIILIRFEYDKKMYGI